MTLSFSNFDSIGLLTIALLETMVFWRRLTAIKAGLPLTLFMNMIPHFLHFNSTVIIIHTDLTLLIKDMIHPL
jgi:hypothetical protein